MAIIGQASVQIRAVDKFFEKDIKAAVRKIKNVEVELHADLNMTKVNKKLRDLRYRLRNNLIELPADIDIKKVEEKLTKMKTRVEDKGINIGVRADTKGATTKLEELRTRYSKVGARVTATADTAFASAQLAWLSRNRISVISPMIDRRSQRAIMGFFHTLTGTLPAEQIRNSITSVMANFESLAVKIPALLAGLGALSNAGLTLGANLFSIADDVLQLTGGLAMIPASLGAIAAIVAVQKIAWQGFTEAVGGNEEALAKLTPVAREAALALQGVGAPIASSIQTKFWNEMGTSLQDFIHSIRDDLEDELGNIGGTVGKITGDALRFMWEAASSGEFGWFLQQVDKGLQNFAKGVNPIIEAFGRLGRVGAEYLPELGNYFGELGIKFGDFIRKADEAGKINEWIETATRRFQELVSISGSVGGIFSAIAKAADMSGAKGLTELANGMREIDDIMNGDRFQAGLVNVFTGAREGMDAMGEGIAELAVFVGENTQQIRSFLTLTGQIAGRVFSSIKVMFDGTGLGSGLMDALTGARDALTIMEPGFRDFGTLLGDLGEIAGEVLRNMAPGINQLMSTMAGVVAGMKDGILTAMPVFNEFIQAILLVVSGPIVALAEGVGNLLELFGQLPGPIQTVIAALGLVIALKGPLGGIFAGMAAGAKKAFAQTALDANTGARALTPFGTAVQTVRTSWANFGREISHGSQLGGFVTGMDRVKGAAGGAARAIGTTAGQGLRLAGAGLMGALGGPWGLALTGAVIGIAAFGQAQADAAAKVDGLAATLDKQTGAFSSTSKVMLATELFDLDATPMDDFFRSGRRNMEELVAATGANMTEMTRIISDPAGRDAYVANWQAIRDAAGDGNEMTAELAATVGMTREQFEGLSQTDLNEMVANIENAAKMAEQAEQKVLALAEATGTTSNEARILQANFDTLASSTTSVSEKMSALKQNMDIFADGSMSALEAQKGLGQAMRDSSAGIQAVADANKGVVNSLVDANGQFDVTTQAGADLHTAMQTAGDGILEVGVSAYQATLQATGDIGKAKTAALDAIKAPTASFRDTLANDFGFSKEQIDGIIKQLGLVPEDVKTALGVEGGEAARQEIFRTELAAKAFGSGNFEAVLGALPDSAKTAIEDATGLAGAFAKGDYAAILEALDKTGPGKEAALASILAVTGGEEGYEAWIKAHDDTKPGVDSAKAYIEENTKGLRPQIDIEARNNTQGGVSAAQGTMGMLEDVTRFLFSEDKSGPGKTAAQITMNGLTSVTRFLFGEDKTADGKNKAQGTLETLRNVTRSLFGLDKTAPEKNKAQGTLETLKNVTRSLFGSDKTAPEKNKAQGTLETLKNVTRSLFGRNEAGPGKNSAQSTLESLANVTRSLFGRNETHAGKNSAQGTINQLTGKTVNLEANDNASGIVRNLIDMVIPNKSFSIVGVLSGVSSVVRKALGMADGGILSGSGVQEFANGGITKAIGSINSFANGSENHVAQMTRRGGPLRIWSEPETGGEAYIPLSATKRVRSLKILQKVADEFGYGLFKQFADGGIESGISMRGSSPTGLRNVTSTASVDSFTPVGASGGVNVTIFPSEGMNEKEVGKSVVKEINWEMLSR